MVLKSQVLCVILVVPMRQLVLNKGTIIPFTLLASAIIGFLTLTGIYLLPSTITELATHIELDPAQQLVEPGEVFTVAVKVSSAIPVNAFTGVVTFNERVLAVDKIDYNTSIADLWVKEPWYSKDTSTITFTGGTTRAGGFIGTGSLLIITFKALEPGIGMVTLSDMRILKSDGRGSDVPLAEHIDTVFTVASSSSLSSVVQIPESTRPTSIQVVTTIPSTDLNGDGKTSLGDLSIFMLDLVNENMKSDFNGDGEVSTADMSILLQAL